MTEKVTRAKNVHHSMKVELQDVEARDQKKYEKKVNEFERRLKKAQQELRAAKNSAVSALLPPLRALPDKTEAHAVQVATGGQS